MNKPWKKKMMRWRWAGWLGLLALLGVMPASGAAERAALVEFLKSLCPPAFK